ncbi:MAG: helix-turn-helix domain-containing protein [Fibromonadaceae bacterium]|jgi:cytoskeletal protein RodZ|nr:helix-turn-helix domain-containing protein [Fibromonadaceae bacterium]
MAEKEQEIEKSFGSNEKVGDYLRRIREAQGIELKQLAKHIRLSEEILLAIEESRWGYFKIEAYLRSYIVSICEKLSLDKQEVLKKFSSEKNSQSVSSIVGVEEKQGVGGATIDSTSNNNNMIVIKAAIVLLVFAALFFAAKVLNGKKDTMASMQSEIAEPEIPSEEEDSEAQQDSLAAINDSIAALAGVKIDSSAIDTLRFECSPAETDSTCGITLRGLDTKVRYFRRMERRYIARSDTSQITITVPARTRLFINSERLDHGKNNTLLFYNGEIIKKYNREIR